MGYKKNEPKRNCPNREAIQRLIIEKMKEYTDKIIDLKVEKREFTAKTLVEKIKNTHSCKTVGEIFLQQIEQLKRTGLDMPYHIHKCTTP